MRALIIGHFSTVGDIEVLQEVEQQLASIPLIYDVAPLAKGMVRFQPDWLNIHTIDPAHYTHLLVVCGPFWRPFYIRYGIDLDRFAHCTRIGINLSMIDNINVYNPFDRLIGRDNDNWVQPDISLLHAVNKIHVAGLCLAPPQKEYGGRQKHEQADDVLRSLARRSGMAIIELDTEWPAERNSCRIASPEQFESICARLDVMLTTRLHGTVLSLKNGVPVVAIDAISGGGKVQRQARALGWSEVYSIDQVTDSVLDEALARCLHPVARDGARDCAANAQKALSNFSRDFADALKAEPQARPSFTGVVVKPKSIRKKLGKLVGKFARRLVA